MNTSLAVDLRRHPCTVFGCEVVLASVGRPATAFAQVEAHLRHLERRFSRFVRGNELAALNGAEGRWVEIGPEMERLLAHALRVAVESHGLVNIAVSPAVRRAGYVAPWPSAWRPAEPCAGPAAVPTLTEVLELRPGRARLARGSAVDFGALAKGLWADDAATRLGADAAASLGGDVAAHGGGPEGEGWPVGLPGGRTLLLRDGGVATSGTSKRAQGGRHHVIDPRTGLPARSGLREVTVVAGSAATAEWLATAVLVAGADSAPARHPDVVACFPTPDEPGGLRDG
jgi:FAD:protein FMN transferase